MATEATFTFKATVEAEREAAQREWDLWMAGIREKYGLTWLEEYEVHSMARLTSATFLWPDGPSFKEQFEKYAKDKHLQRTIGPMHGPWKHLADLPYVAVGKVRVPRGQAAGRYRRGQPS